MGMMVFDTVGLVQVVVHDDGAPDAATWSAYVAETRQLIARVSGDISKLTALIISDRGVPSGDQRAEFLRLLDGHPLRSSIVSRSVLVRAAVRSVNLFNRAMRPFSPEALSDALDHISVPSARRRELLSSLARLAPRIPSAHTLREVIGANATGSALAHGP
jgi:hypothetical protein